MDNQEAFRQAVKAAQSRRGGLLSEAEMMAAAQTMGAPDPFPIGLQFSNQTPVAAPRTNEEVARANLREALQRKLAERESGIRAYESQTGLRPGQTQGDVNTLFARNAQNLKQGRGIIPDKRAEYLLSKRENEQQRNMMLERAAANVAASPNPLMTLQDYRDPIGAFNRRMAERAFGLREQALAGEAADRAEALGIRREGLGVEKERIASQERIAGEGNRLADAREARREELQIKMTELENRLADARADRNDALQRDLQREKIKAETELANIQAKSAERRSEDDLYANLMTKVMEAAVSQDPQAWATIQPRLPELMRSIQSMRGGGQGVALPPAPQAKTEMGKFQQENPELYSAWTSAMGGQGDAPRKSATDFVMAIPEQEIKNNKEAFRTFLESAYGEPLDDLLVSGIDVFSDKRPARFNRLRQMYGLAPNQTTALRTWGAAPFIPPGAFDAFFGTPQ